MKNLKSNSYKLQVTSYKIRTVIRKLLILCFFVGSFLFTLAKPVEAARLYFEPGEARVSRNTSFDANIYVDTEGARSTGVDVVLTFDASRVTVDTVSFSSIFSRNVVRQRDNSGGRLEFSAYFDDLFSSYQGRDRLATVRFRSRESNTNVNFVCTNGGSADTNVMALSDGDVVNCSNLGNLQVTISEVNPSPSPNASPSPSPTSVGGTGCDRTSPSRPTGLKATAGPGRGQVTLRWNRVGGATHYAIAYGERWLDFDYGAPNVGDTDSFVVNGLRTGVPYYFVVAAVNECASSGWSDGASSYAGWGAVAVSRQTIQEKGWEPPEPIKVKSDEEEASEGAAFNPSPMPSPSLKPYYEPPTPHKPWEGTDFWKKVGLVVLILFLLWLLLGFLRRRRKHREMKEMEEVKSTEVRETEKAPWESETEQPQTPPPFSSEHNGEDSSNASPLPPPSPPPPF